MTPKEKAQQLKESFNNSLTAKDCCLVCVEEILEELDNISFNENEYGFVDGEYENYKIKFWIDVKKQIELL